jgi:hypothetical protein
MDRRFKRVLGVAATLYEDLWTAGKVMYKLEPILSDGGELVLYAPHVSEVSFTHGRHLDRIGYHCLDYFQAQMDRFAEVPPREPRIPRPAKHPRRRVDRPRGRRHTHG